MRVFLVLFGILSGLNGYAAASAGARLSLFGSWTLWVSYFFAALLCLELVVPLFALPNRSSFANPPAVPPRLIQLAYLAFGFTACFFVYSLAADALGWLSAFFIAPDHLMDLNRFLVLAVWGGTFATIAVGLYNARSAAVYTTEISFQNLPPAFDGFKIVQLSDLHISPFIREAFLRNVIAKTQKLSPDMIALTGDIADGRVETEASVAHLLASLRAPCGFYYVTGNHEYYWGARGWTDFLQDDCGLTVLDNAHVVLEKGDDKIVIGGVPDTATLRMKGFEKTDIAAAFHSAAPGQFKILLSHQPSVFPEAVQQGVDLQLSGHTHGGQFFPFTRMVRFFQPYVKGLYRDGHRFLYVSRGTGLWGPPLRTNGRGEITLITLRKI
jgi:predicted MPP superfamily phosphohydrolase